MPAGIESVLRETAGAVGSLATLRRSVAIEPQIVIDRYAEMCAMLSRIQARVRIFSAPTAKRCGSCQDSMLSPWDVSAYRCREQTREAWHTPREDFESLTVNKRCAVRQEAH